MSAAPARLALIAPEENLQPRDAGVWILDLSRMEAGAALARVQAVEGPAAESGARLLLLNPPAVLSGRGDKDLAHLLGTVVEGLDFNLDMPSLARYVPAIRRFVAVRVGAAHEARAAFAMELVLDELCLNAVEHGSPPPARVEVEVRLDGCVLHYSIANEHPRGDASAPVLPSRLKESDPSGVYLGERGRGLFLVARLADGLSIRNSGRRICVHVWKDLSRL